MKVSSRAGPRRPCAGRASRCAGRPPASGGRSGPWSHGGAASQPDPQAGRQRASTPCPGVTGERREAPDRRERPSPRKRSAPYGVVLDDHEPVAVGRARRGGGGDRGPSRAAPRGSGSWPRRSTRRGRGRRPARASSRSVAQAVPVGLDSGRRSRRRCRPAPASASDVATGASTTTSSAGIDQRPGPAGRGACCEPVVMQARPRRRHSPPRGGVRRRPPTGAARGIPSVGPYWMASGP